MFKDKLKELRTIKGITQKDLADKIFVSRSAIAKWENGNGYPSEVNLEALCSYFGVEEEWLMERNDYKENIKINSQKGKRVIQLVSIILPLCCFILTFINFICVEPPFSSYRGPNSFKSLIYVYGGYISILYCLLFIPISLSIMDIILMKKNNNKYWKLLNTCMIITTTVAYIAMEFFVNFGSIFWMNKH